jgi:hypothetical protein
MLVQAMVTILIDLQIVGLLLLKSSILFRKPLSIINKRNLLSNA